VSQEIFRLCSSTSWMALENGVLQVNIRDSSCKLLSMTRSATSAVPVLLYPLRSVMEELRQEFLRTELPNSQHQLRLPPTAIANNRTSRRRA